MFAGHAQLRRRRAKAALDFPFDHFFNFTPRATTVDGQNGRAGGRLRQCYRPLSLTQETGTGD
jgi:hypothetical protein